MQILKCITLDRMYWIKVYTVPFL